MKNLVFYSCRVMGGRWLAVKCIERRRLTKVSMENLITEIKVMREMDHKHIVKLKDFEVSFKDDTVFRKLQYIATYVLA